MRAEQHLEASFRAVLKNMNLPWPDKAVIEPSKDPKHGDLASNLALVSAKAAGMPPRELAAKMAEALRNEDTSLASVEVAGPGFLNVTFSPEFWRETIRRIDDAARSLWAGHCWERLQGTGGVRFGQPHRPSPYRSWPGRGGGRYLGAHPPFCRL